MKKELSQFMCRELLYEYATGQLDEKRVEQVKEFISNDDQLKKDLDKINYALKYTKELSNSEITNQYQELLSNKKVVQEESLWVKIPDIWKKAMEATVMAVVVFVVIKNVPFNLLKEFGENKVKNSQVILEKDSNNSGPEFTVDDSAVREIVDLEDENSNLDEQTKITEKTVKSLEEKLTPVNEKDILKEDITEKPFITETDSKATEDNSIQSYLLNLTEKMFSSTEGEKSIGVEAVDKGESVNDIKTASKATTNLQASVKVKTVKSKNLVKNITEVEKEKLALKELEVKPSVVKKKEKAISGLVYRGSVHVDNANIIADLLVDNIHEHGGKKAGNVRLGWKKVGARYFHFIISENKFNNVKNFINKYGKLELKEFTHWRVMPKGKLRIIIELKQTKNVDNKSTATDPQDESSEELSNGALDENIDKATKEIQDQEAVEQLEEEGGAEESLPIEKRPQETQENEDLEDTTESSVEENLAE